MLSQAKGWTCYAKHHSFKAGRKKILATSDTLFCRALNNVQQDDWSEIPRTQWESAKDLPRCQTQEKETPKDALYWLKTPGGLHRAGLKGFGQVW